jgi:uncharacterized protein (TIGR02145 family)
MPNIIGALCFVFLLFGCTLPKEERDDIGGYTGPYGSVLYKGQSYKTVAIGTQTWMAENLNHAVEGSKCYKNLIGYCNIYYGRLYDWSTAMGLSDDCNSGSCISQIQEKHQGICPDGWHIPSDEDWTILTDFVGIDSGIKLRATRGWDSCSGFCSSYDGTDQYGFSALPGGHGDSYGSFGEYTDGYWWTATEDSSCNNICAHFRNIEYGSKDVIPRSWYKTDLHSVRCVKD